MRLESLDGCRLTIGSYPTFLYNAIGGGGEAFLSQINEQNLQHIKFDPLTFVMPSLNWSTTKLLGLPMPLGLEIKMCLDRLEGSIDKSNGYISLNFKSRFFFSIFSKLHAPPLIVETFLETGEVKSERYTVEGMPLQKDGRTRLVGVSNIEPCGNNLMDIFLGLPTEALAILECKLSD